MLHSMYKSIFINIIAFVTVLTLILVWQMQQSLSEALRKQYEARLANVITHVAHITDADDLRDCIQSGVSSPKRDQLQQTLNRMVDDYELAFLYIVITRKGGQGVMINAVSATSQAERDAGETDQPLLWDETDCYEPEVLELYSDAWLHPEKITFFEDDSDYGPCYTGIMPLRDSNGEVVCAVCADYSMETVSQSVQRYAVKETLIIILTCIVFGALLMLWLGRNVTRKSESLTYSRIARALAADYLVLYYVNLDTDSYQTLSSQRETGRMIIREAGDDFFKTALREAQTVLYQDDLEVFKQAFQKGNILRYIDTEGAFTLTYRQMMDGTPTYIIYS